jgi:hypothetical protein
MQMALDDAGKRLAQLGFALRADDPRHLGSVAQEDERGPQLDAEGTAERAARPVFDLEMPHARLLGQGGLDHRLGGTAVTAPAGAELKHGSAGKGFDVAARRGFGGVVAWAGHGGSRCG